MITVASTMALTYISFGTRGKDFFSCIQNKGVGMIVSISRILGTGMLSTALLFGQAPGPSAQTAESAQTSQTDETAEGDGAAFLWHPGLGLTPDAWYISNFAIKKPEFRTAWSRHNVRIVDGALELSLRPARPDNAEDLATGKDFIGAEVQHQPLTRYGRYEVVMTAARGLGVISSMFTYTGPHFGTQHDEIDFEFLGRDTTKVWLNRFVDGQKLPGEWVDLGFDSAEEPHLYAFEWTPESIVWTVDGREMLRAEAPEKTMPVTPGMIYLNIWAGGELQDSWSGNAPDGMEAMARYYCLSFRPMGSEAPQCSDGTPGAPAGE
jgi:endo-1,3-1,4-beta-glycanase ExoK